MPKNLEISYLLDFYGKLLTEKQRTVMEQYFNDDLSLAEIAADAGITRQGVRDAIKHGEATVLEMEEKMGLARAYRFRQEQLTQLEELVRNVRYYNNAGSAFDSRIEAATRDSIRIIHRLSEQEEV